jgi:hypothetical protein
MPSGVLRVVGDSEIDSNLLMVSIFLRLLVEAEDIHLLKIPHEITHPIVQERFGNDPTNFFELICSQAFHIECAQVYSTLTLSDSECELCPVKR